MTYSPQVGKRIYSRYEIVKPLGSGGFGDTYLAVDLGLPGNPQCVVKHLKPKDPNPTVLPIAKSLFQREAQILYQLGNDCNQIPHLFAHFEENNEFYLVQEFVDGHDLSYELIPGTTKSEKVVVKLLKDILEVLAFVHEHNVIHRDIKPQNIMRRSSDGKIILIDFGAVKEINVLSMASTGQTSLTVAVGSPGYMPNEQANGKPRLSSDVYAVGMIGIQALTGLLPQQLQEDAVTGELSWRHLVPVSDSVANVLEKMVRDHFSQRYQSGAEALSALNATMVVPPTQVPRPPIQPTVPILQPTQSIPVPIQINRPQFSKWAGFGIVGLVIAAFFAVYPKLFTPATSSTSKDNPISTTSSTSTTSPTSTTSSTSTISPTSTTRPTSTTNALYYYNRGSDRYALKDYQGAISNFNRAIAINPNYATAYNDRGIARHGLKDYQGATSDYNQAITINPNYGKAYYNRGNVRNDLKNYQAAISDYSQAIAINPNYGKAYNNRGLARYHLKDYQAAISDYNQAITINPNYANAYNNRGLARNYLGNKQDAIQDYRKAADLYKEQGNESDYQDTLNQIKALGEL